MTMLQPNARPAGRSAAGPTDGYFNARSYRHNPYHPGRAQARPHKNGIRRNFSVPDSTQLATANRCFSSFSSCITREWSSVLELFLSSVHFRVLRVFRGSIDHKSESGETSNRNPAKHQIGIRRNLLAPDSTQLAAAIRRFSSRPSSSSCLKLFTLLLPVLPLPRSIISVPFQKRNPANKTESGETFTFRVIRAFRGSIHRKPEFGEQIGIRRNLLAPDSTQLATDFRRFSSRPSCLKLFRPFHPNSDQKKNPAKLSQASTSALFIPCYHAHRRTGNTLLCPSVQSIGGGTAFPFTPRHAEPRRTEIALTEEMLWIGENPRLWGMLHRPADSGYADRAVVFCAPFAEEEKCSRRLYVELARELAARGIASLRFSYRGSGDSTGDFSDLRLQAAINDIRAATDCCQELTGASSITLFGLRLGGAFALEAVRQGVAAERVALWAPVVNGKSYVRMNIRRKSIRRMINTAGPAAESAADPIAAPGEAAADSIFDFDGYPVAPALWDDLEALTAAPPEGWKGQALLVSVGSTEKPSGESAALAAKLEAAGVEVKLETVISQPFWNLLGLIECPEIIRLTADWIAA